LNKLRALWARYNNETLRYLIAGGTTTLLDLALFLLLNHVGVEETVASYVSVAVAIAYAYVVNKLFVFRRHAENGSALALELLKFLGGRVFTMAVEHYGTVWLLGLTGRAFISKSVMIVVVFVLNYIISKLLVFRKGGKHADERENK
jgi:putative flippase GtrA